MNTTGIVVGMALVGAGLVAVLVAAWQARNRRGVLAYLSDSESAAYEQDTVALPSIGERLLRPLARRFTSRIRDLYPSRHLDRLHHQILCSGMSATVTAEEVATVQVVAAGLGILFAVVLGVAAGGSVKLRLVLGLVIVMCAALGPPAWLSRRVQARTDAIERDLPDVLDLLTIAVESGLGLEQAMDATCSNFDSPMAEELSRTLQELSLGLSRREALENLKQRSESTDLANFIVVLSQADVLGMPIGRVLRSQADEMRERRRARARERAAKLPVKIVFPLIVFILPPLMILVLGPAVSAMARTFGF